VVNSQTFVRDMERQKHVPRHAISHQCQAAATAAFFGGRFAR